MNEEKLTYEQAKVLSKIPVEYGERISKAELNMLCGYDDRKVRKILEELRTEGFFIISLGDGLWLADPENEADLDAMERYHKMCRSAAIAYFKRLSPMRRMLINKGRKVK